MRMIISVLAMLVTFPALAADPVLSVPYRANGYGTLPSDKIIVRSVIDPKVEGVACWWSKPQLGHISGALGLADDPSDISLDCKQIGPISFKAKFRGKPSDGENIAKESRNWNGFKTAQIIRTCDPVTNALVYLTYSDRIIEGSPKNAMSVVVLKDVKCKDNY